MEGVDCAGKHCKIFIENNGSEAPDGMKTVPTIITDSEILSGMTQGTLYGEISGTDDGTVEIRIYAETVPSARETFDADQGKA